MDYTDKLYAAELKEREAKIAMWQALTGMLQKIGGLVTTAEVELKRAANPERR